MANFFSDHLASSVSGSFDPSYRPDPGANGQKVRYERIQFSLTAAALNDTVVLKTMKSNSRIKDMRLTTNGTSATGAVNVGLYKAPATLRDHVPVAANIVDADLFATAVAVTAAISRTDIFVEGELDDYHRGQPLWYLADLGAGTYSVDPMEDWDIVMTFSTALADTQDFLVEIEWVEVG